MEFNEVQGNLLVSVFNMFTRFPTALMTALVTKYKALLLNNLARFLKYQITDERLLQRFLTKA